MGKAGAVRRTAGADDLFDRVGAFLADHRLGCEPATYALVHRALSEPDGPLAAEVARLTDGGVRLAREDVERLGGRVAPTTRPAPRSRAKTPPVEQEAARLVAETQAQVDGFADMMHRARCETRGFGRDLAESAAALGERGPQALADVSRLTSAMVKRVRVSEERLAQATDEAEGLRAKLAEANATARRDPLTGLPNRLAFAEAYAARDARAGPHCLALCDVDRFKRINDAHGHGVGDRVLAAIGQALAEACEGHLVSRHGGEEYAVLLSGVPLADAAAQLDAARERIAERRFRNRDTGESLDAITFSAGVTAIRADESADEATERADRLLYAAKDRGRDQICAG